MTEEEWLTTHNKFALFHHACRRETAGRKFRLLMAGWLRVSPPDDPDPRWVRALDIAERYADDRSVKWEARAIHSCRISDLDTPFDCLVWPYQISIEHAALRFVMFTGGWIPRRADDPTAPTAREREMTALFHCIFGNPFRPVAFDPSWRSETAVALAAGIYEERAFDRLPILADALEEAGCDAADVLSHCRGPGPHARGCRVVDGVLGKGWARLAE